RGGGSVLCNGSATGLEGGAAGRLLPTDRQQCEQPPAKFIDRHCRLSPCSICAAAIAVRAIARNDSSLPLWTKAARNRHSVVVRLMAPRVARQVGVATSVRTTSLPRWRRRRRGERRRRGSP